MFTNNGLVAFVTKALKEKWGYVYGTFGKVLTETLLQQKKVQYPDNIIKYEPFIRANWLGKRAADCVGLIKAYIWWNGTDVIYSSVNDVSANGMYYAAKEKGPISTIPEIPGLCVWKNGHIGIYIGNGQVIEAKGTKYGVVQTPLKGSGSSKWTNWLKCPYIEYDDTIAYKIFIQSKCNFSNPSGVWAITDKHPYAEALYMQWAKSYKK